MAKKSFQDIKTDLENADLTDEQLERLIKIAEAKRTDGVFTLTKDARIQSLQAENRRLNKELEFSQRTTGAHGAGAVVENAHLKAHVYALMEERDNLRLLAEDYENIVQDFMNNSERVWQIEADLEQSFIDDFNEMSEAGYTPEPLLIIKRSYIKVQEMVRESYENQEKAIVPQTDIVRGLREQLDYLMLRHRNMGIGVAARDMVTNASMYLGSIPFICWSIIFGLKHNYPDETLSASLQRLPREWIEANLDRKPSYSTLMAGLRLANLVENGAKISDLAQETFNSEPLIKRYRQWYNTIKRTKTNSLPEPQEPEADENEG